MRVFRLVTVLVAILLLGGCERKIYSRMQIDVLSSPPVAVNLTSRRLRLRSGIAVQIRLKPISRDAPYEKSDRVVVQSQDTGTLSVFATDKDDRVVLVGGTPGTTCLEIEINGVLEECIDTEVQSPD